MSFFNRKPRVRTTGDSWFKRQILCLVYDRDGAVRLTNNGKPNKKLDELYSEFGDAAITMLLSEGASLNVNSLSIYDLEKDNS